MKGKRVLITGGGSGIGLALAKAASHRGASVVITGRNVDKLDRAAAGDDRIEGRVCDVTDDSAVTALRNELAATGGVDVLVNNAGIARFFDITTLHPLEEQQQEVDTNIMGPITMIQRFLPDMLDRDSMIVNISSGLAFIPLAAAPVYSGTKAFLHAYTRCLRTQLRETSVRVVEVLPPVVATPMIESVEMDGIKAMDPAEFADEVFRGLDRNRELILPGMTSRLRLMNRVAPEFAYNQLNRAPLPNAGSGAEG
ncbi:MAG: SDR family NAD(P)-dependent oxidoreductase [Planctomycetota bacterium]